MKNNLKQSILSTSRSEYQRINNYYSKSHGEHFKGENVTDSNASNEHEHDNFSESSICSMSAEKVAGSNVSDRGSLKRGQRQHLSLRNNRNKSSYNQPGGISHTYDRKFGRNHFRFITVTKPSANDAKNAQLMNCDGAEGQEKENEPTSQSQHHFNEGKLCRHGMDILCIAKK